MTLSYQLYSSRNFGPLAETCKMLSELGYKAVEPFGALFEDADALGEAAARAGLAMPTAHVNLDDLESDPDHIIALANRFGIQNLYVPFLMPEDRPSDADGWRAFGARLVKAGAPLKAAGLGFGWHNHEFEFETFGDATALDLIFDGNDLEWECDVAWIVRGDADPKDWIKKYANRITSVHVKDIAPEGEKTDEDGWADPGTGTVDWPGIYDALQSSNAAVFVMEHDNPSSDSRFAKAAHDYFRTLEG